MAGYVYLIGTPVFQWYKIGKSRVPQIRVCDLGILLPFKIEVIGVWKAQDHTALESLLHAKYASQQVNGEWFHFSKEAVERLFASLPAASRIFPSDNNPDSVFAKFSNIDKDLRDGKQIRVRVQKLRGNFTPEEREARRIASMKLQKEKKELRLAQQNLDFANLP
jgi:hypothetical protein